MQVKESDRRRRGEGGGEGTATARTPTPNPNPPTPNQTPAAPPSHPIPNSSGRRIRVRSDQTPQPSGDPNPNPSDQISPIPIPMAIVYALVARGTVVLAEFAAVSGNAGAVARRILEKLPPDADSRLCFAQDRYIFHVLRADAGITFLCMANDTFGSIPLAFNLLLYLSMYCTVLYDSSCFGPPTISLPHTSSTSCF